MDRWIGAALDYIPRWLEYQMRLSEQPGLALAVAWRGQVVLEQAFGHADALRGVPLTPRHRFRVASHSKSFTAAGMLKLREQGRLKLDDRAGQYISGLDRRLAQSTIAQLLSHSAGLVRDGADSGHWQSRKPFPDAARLRADLQAAPIIDGSSRFKYSNHGYGLAGLVIEALTGEPYGDWIRREIVEPAGLAETLPDVPLPRGTPFARGHSGKLPLGRRVIFPGDMSTHAMAPATGFVSTAGDLARFFRQLSPGVRRSPISAASRREMVRAHWPVPHSSLGQSYGLGIISGKLGDWEWFGHGGAFQGYITRTAAVPAQELSVSVLTNASDGWAHPWLDGVLHILRCYARNGAPTRGLSDWSGRWWSVWGAIDLVPTARRVLVAMPGLANPLLDAGEIEITGRDRGRIALAGGFASHGEPVRRLRKGGKVAELWLAGGKLLDEKQMAREIESRYSASRSR